MNFAKLKSRVVNFKLTGPGLYATAFVAYFITSFLRNSTYADYIISANFLQRCNYLLVAVLLAKIYFFDQQTPRRFITNSILIAIGLVVWRQAHALDILMMLLLILGARDLPFTAINDWYLKIGALLMAFVICSVGVGLIRDLIFVREGVNRHSLGILYPTDFAAHVFFLLLAYCTYAFERLKWWHYLIFLAIAAVLMKVTQARLDVIAIVLIIPVFWLAKRAKAGKVWSKLLAGFYWGVPIVLGYITAMLGIFYTSKNHLFQAINKLISGRLKIAQEAVDNYGIDLFGNRVVEHGFGAGAGEKMFYKSGMGGSYFYIDSSYIRLLVIYGLLALAFFLIVMTAIAWRSTMEGDYRLAAAMALIALSCVIEQHLLDLSFNPFLIALLADTSMYSQSHLEVKS